MLYAGDFCVAVEGCAEVGRGMGKGFDELGRFDLRFFWYVDGGADIEGQDRFALACFVSGQPMHFKS